MMKNWLGALARLLPAVCIALVLLLTFRLYRFAYFYLDDFNNLALTQRISGWTMLWSVTHPSSNVFRPVGFLAQWICLHSFYLQPLPYHVFAWTVHSVNVLLVFLMLRHASRSSYAAALGSLLFSFQMCYSEIFYNFGTTIFDLLSGFFFFLSLLLYLERSDSRIGLVLCWVTYFVASNSKEMALTLPGVWLLYELVVRDTLGLSGPDKARERVLKEGLQRLARRFIIPALIAFWFVYSKASMMTDSSASSPYRMSFTLGTLCEGYGWFFNEIRVTRLHWSLWMTVAMVVFFFLLFKRSRWGIFFLAYVFLTLLPVLFMPSHRFSHYWYIPFLGLCGLACVAARWAVEWAQKLLSARTAAVAGMLFFVLAARSQYFDQKKLTTAQRNWAREVSQEYRSFVGGLVTLGQPQANAVVYFRSLPRFFDPVTATSVLQLVFRREDLQSALVDTFPPDAKYRVRFENSQVIVEGR